MGRCRVQPPKQNAATEPSPIEIYHYCDEVDEELICPICSQPFLSPVACSNTACGNIFCQLCLSAWLKRNPSCPKCRNPLEHGIPMRAIASQCDRLLVQCSSDGCDWKGKREDIRKHLVNCAEERKQKERDRKRKEEEEKKKDLQNKIKALFSQLSPIIDGEVRGTTSLRKTCTCSYCQLKQQSSSQLPQTQVPLTGFHQNQQQQYFGTVAVATPNYGSLQVQAHIGRCEKAIFFNKWEECIAKIWDLRCMWNLFENAQDLQHVIDRDKVEWDLLIAVGHFINLRDFNAVPSPLFTQPLSYALIQQIANTKRQIESSANTNDELA